MFTVYAITPNAKEGQKDYWNPVGIGFDPNQDGSINLRLHMFPGLQLQIRENKPDAQEQPKQQGGQRNGR